MSAFGSHQRSRGFYLTAIFLFAACGASRSLQSNAPHTLIHANTAPETLSNHLVVGTDDTDYFAWINLDADNRAQFNLRTLVADRRSWSPIQQFINSKGNVSRATLALKNYPLQIAWAEIDGEDSRVVFRSATLGQ